MNYKNKHFIIYLVLNNKRLTTIVLILTYTLPQIREDPCSGSIAKGKIGQ